MMGTFHQVTYDKIIADALAPVVAKIPIELMIAGHGDLPFRGYK
jgi:hypothetical protein